MKYFFFLGLLIISQSSCNNSAKSAVKYNDYIVGKQSKVMKNIMDFVKVADYNLDSADRMLDRYVVELDGTIADIRAMKPFKGSTEFRDAAVNSFTFYRKIFSNEYKQLIDLRRNGARETEEGMTEINRIVDQISSEEKGYDKAFHDAQRKFASENNMQLRENEMQKKIEKMGN